MGTIEQLLDQSSKQRALELYGEHVSSGKRAFYRSIDMELVMGRREGIHFWDLDGRQLINCHCNGGVFNLGHRHPALVQALSQALERLDIGNHHLMSGLRAELARRLARGAPGELDHVVFGCGGGEAIDLAIKLSRAHTGRAGIVSACGGYHGHTGLALAAGDPQYRDPFGPMCPGFHQVPFDDLSAMDAAVGAETAAVILETVPATLGMPVARPDYFREVQRLCHERGALLISDEVQAGLGRTGRLWGIEHFGASPDILVTAKGLGGGLYPLAATLYTAELDRFLAQNPFIHISTTGGAELGCAVGLAVLDQLEAPGFLEQVQARAAQLSQGLAQLSQRHPFLEEVRQLGLMMGLQTVNEGVGQIFCRAAMDHGLFCIYANNDKRVVQFLPPLIITEEQAQDVLERVDATFSQLEQLMGGG